MKLGWMLSVGIFLCALGILRTVTTEMWQEEVRTRLTRFPEAMIRIAIARLPVRERHQYGEEWRSELSFVLSDTEGLPVTRFLRGTRFAFGLLRVSGDIAQELERSTGASSNSESGLKGPISVVGYRGQSACTAAGITYRQLDYWARTGLVSPSVPAKEPASYSLYSALDILILSTIKHLLNAGSSLSAIRGAVAHLKECGLAGAGRLTLISDGQGGVYVCTYREAADLLHGDRGFFGIAIGRIQQDVATILSELPNEPS